MKRVFITTNVGQAVAMYNRTGHETRKARVETDLASLTTAKEYCYGNDFKVIVLADTFTSWNDYTIVQENDYILYHTTSTPDVIATIKSLFFNNHIQNGSHILNRYHDKVYRILFDDNNTDKLNSILEVLGFDDATQKHNKELESKLNFLHHCLTPDGLKNEEVTNSDWAKLEDFTKLTAAEDGPFGDSYLSALRTLRNKLLTP